MNMISRWIRRVADGEYDAYLGVAVFGLAMGALFAVSMLMEGQ
jgi:esterase/lipase